MADAEAAAHRLARALQKKLQQIDSLHHRAGEGLQLDAQQMAKLSQRPVLLSALAALQGGMPAEEVQVILSAASSEREEKHGERNVEEVSGGKSASSLKSGKGKNGGGSAQRAVKRRASEAKAKEGSSEARFFKQPEALDSLGLDANSQDSPSYPSSPAIGCFPNQAARTVCTSTTGNSIASLALSTAQLALDDSDLALGSSPPSTIPAFGELGHAAELPLKRPGEQFVGGFKVADEPWPLNGGASKSKDKAKRKGTALSVT